MLATTNSLICFSSPCHTCTATLNLFGYYLEELYVRTESFGPDIKLVTLPARYHKVCNIRLSPCADRVGRSQPMKGCVDVLFYRHISAASFVFASHPATPCTLSPGATSCLNQSLFPVDWNKSDTDHLMLNVRKGNSVQRLHLIHLLQPLCT